MSHLITQHGVGLVLMDIANQWPLILVVLAVFIIVAGILQKIAKVAFIGVALAAVGLFLWPFVADVL